MDIKQLSKVVDKVYTKVKPYLQNIPQENVYEVIMKGIKRHNIKEMDFDETLQEELIYGVKQRYVPSNDNQFGIAPRIVRRIRSDSL